MRAKLGSILALLVFLAAGTAEAQQRTLRGTIVEAVNGQPVGGATVQVAGTNLGAITENDGTFVLEGVPSGAVTLTVNRLGFRRVEQEVRAGQDEVLIRLQMDLLRMEELVVTGRATQTRRRNLATTVATVSGEQVNEAAPAASVESKLQGKIAGVNIDQNSGAPGGGLQVRIRGSSSIFGRSSPLYIIDGVIVSNDAVANGLNVLTESAGGTNASNQDDPVNRIADLNPEEIESIEVLKGATAAAIYGSKAANGVVIITTKRGEQGAPRVQVSQRLGTFDLSEKIGSRRFETVQEALDAGFAFAAQEPYRSNIEQGLFFDNEQELSDRNDPSFETSVTVSGGSESLGYFGSASWRDDEGIIRSTGFERQTGRLNLQTDLGERFDANVNLGVINSKANRGVANNDNSQISYFMVLSATPSFVDLSPDENGIFPENPAVGNGSNPLQTAALVRNEETNVRAIGSATANFTAFENDRTSLRFNGTAGADLFDLEQELFSPPAAFFEDVDNLRGTSIEGRADSQNLNVNLNGVWEYDWGFDFGFTTTLSSGFQFERTELDVARIFGQGLTAGFPNTNVASAVNIFERKEQVEDFGAFWQGDILAFDERLYLAGSMRFDQSSSNGDPDDVFVFPNVSGSWRFPNLGFVFDELKIRAAWGQSGNQPLFGQKFTVLNATGNVEGITGLTPGNDAGAPDIEPETTTEYEGGFDLTGFDDRASLSMTFYRQEIDDLILQRELAPSTGFQTQFFNGGEMENEGIEASLRVTPVQKSFFSWTSTTVFSTNSSEVLSLPVPAFSPGPGFGIGGDPLIEEGKSLTQIVSTVDGVEDVKVGDTEPEFTFGFTNNFQFLKHFRIHSLVDFRHELDVINLTELLFDFAQVSPDFELPEGVSAPRPIEECNPNCSGLERVVGLGNGDQFQWVQDASFAKLRELSLSYQLPRDLTGRFLGSDDVRVSVSGRNLITVTDYRGLDPEVSNFGNQAVGRGIDVAPFPPSRSYWFTVEATF